MVHLPWNPNTERGDLVASSVDVQIVFEQKVYVQEKVDGANCGMTIFEDHPLIRGRQKFIKKGYAPKTTASRQFASVFNWWHANKKKFEHLAREAGPVSIYGEWMKAQHGMKYDRLPDWFIAYDLYDYEKCHFLDTGRAMQYLKDAGFATAPILFEGDLVSLDHLEPFVNGKTEFSSTELREGVVVKTTDGEWTTAKFKVVRPGFKQGRLWNNDEMRVNSCCRS
jgi:ATP-dependent RNA circularization protein (DNA/RNA ligase family)